MIGLIRVLTTANSEVLNEHGRLISELYAVPVNNECIPGQPLGIYNDETEQLANPKIVAHGQRMEQDGCSVIVVSCAADPAVDLLRRHVSVPVIGAGSTASYMARMIGKPVGVMGITETLPKVMKDILGDLFIRYIQPEGVANTTDLMTPAGRHQAIQAAKTLMEQGIEVIVFACTGFSTIGLAGVLRTELNIPVIDAVEAEGLIASNLYKQLKR